MSVSSYATAVARPLHQFLAAKVFRVPDYQRCYSWTLDNWRDTWDDITEGLMTRSPHYWGPITLRQVGEPVFPQGSSIPFDVFEVVDGQQRIATLLLLLFALSRAGDSQLFAQYIRTDGVWHLELGSLNHEFFRNLIDGPEYVHPDMRTNRLLKEGYEFYRARVDGFLDLGALSRYLLGETFCLEFIVRDPALAIRTFETLNDRGKPLTLLDKTKSYLMLQALRYLGSSESERINVAFGEVYRCYDLTKDLADRHSVNYLSSAQFTENELLRFFYHYFCAYAKEEYGVPEEYYYDASAEDVLDYLVKPCCSSLRSKPEDLASFIGEFLDSITTFSRSLHDILSRISVDDRYHLLFSFLGPSVRVYPLLVALESQGLLDDEVLGLVETLDVRVYKVRGTDPRADLYQGTVSQLKLGLTRDELIENLKQFVDVWMSNELFKVYLQSEMYGSSATKYMLWEYEKHLCPTFPGTDAGLYGSLQIEHVFAQEPSFEIPAFGFKNYEDYTKTVDQLGNLCLLEESINKRIGKLLPDKKAPQYLSSKIPRTRDLGQEISRVRFSKDRIVQLTRDIATFAGRRWPL